MTEHGDCRSVAKLGHTGEWCYLPEWMASASLSGISMLNSYVIYPSAPRTLYLYCDQELSSLQRSSERFPYLLDSHHNLDGVQAVQSKVVGKVCGGLDLH